ncbi:MAG: hypothetical protein KKA19_02140, partial [Candidatus Margulisbacteria bacterium]|nr:hypothetical protein [Candidatus Margulisiibacteriota bacterium]
MREKMLAETTVADFNAENKLLYEVVAKNNTEGLGWLDSLKKEEQQLARGLLLREEPWSEKIIEDCLIVLKKLHSEKSQEQLRAELKEAEAQGDQEKARELLAAMKNIK